MSTIQINSTEIPTLRENDHVLGTPTTTTTTLVLMEYGDYQCSQSGQAHRTIEKLQQHLGDYFCFVFRHFPQSELHPQSFKAAEISEAAGAQGKLWEMHSMLFNNQKQLEDGNLIEYAANLELDIPRVLQEYAHPEIQITVPQTNAKAWIDIRYSITKQSKKQIKPGQSFIVYSDRPHALEWQQTAELTLVYLHPQC